MKNAGNTTRLFFSGFVICYIANVLSGSLKTSTSTENFIRHAIGENNVDSMQQQGHPIPNIADWWTVQPPSYELINSLIPPLERDNGFCTGRLWLPRGGKWSGR